MLKIGITPLVRAETVFKPKIENNNLIQPLNPTPKNNQSRRANPTRSVQQGFRDGKTSRKTIIRCHKGKYNVFYQEYLLIFRRV